MGANSSVPANYNAAACTLLTLYGVLSILAVTGRATARKLMKASPAIDDYLCYLAFVNNNGLLVAGLLLTAFGAFDFEQIQAESQGEGHLVYAITLAVAVLYILAITFIKLSILSYYRRTFTVREPWFRWCWAMLLLLVMLWTIACILLLALYETGNMPHSFVRLGMSITCMVSGFTSIFLMILPAVMMSRLKLEKKQKIALLSIFGIAGIASVVSLVRGAIFLKNREYQFNEAYSNFLDVVLTATESFAGFMCTCLPLTKPVLVCVTRWLQRLRGIDAKHQGWTTNRLEPAVKEKDRTITRVDIYHVQLLPISRRNSARAGEIMDVEKPWQSVGPYGVKTFCESNTTREMSEVSASKWEVQNAWGKV